MFFENKYVNAHTCKKKTQQHAGRATSSNAAASVNRLVHETDIIMPLKWSPGTPGSIGQRKSDRGNRNDESRLILGIAELFITTTAKHLGGIAVELVSVNPYVPKNFGS